MADRYCCAEYQVPITYGLCMGRVGQLEKFANHDTRGKILEVPFDICTTACLIILYPPWFFWKSGQSSKFWKILGTHQFVMNLNKNEAKKKFFLKKKIKMADSKKLSFSTTPKSWSIFTKISQIGPWVCRINWWEGHPFCSTYMVIRLSDVSSIYIGHPDDHLGWAK